MRQYLNEFLFRGRAEGDPTPPEWHVIIAEPDDVDGFGRVRKGGDTGAITPERADKEFGWPVSRVLDGINAAALYEADRLRAANVILAKDCAALEARLAEACHDVSRLQAEIEHLTGRRPAPTAALNAASSPA